MVNPSKEWKEEQQRVNTVIGEIERKQAEFKRTAGDVKEGIMGLRKNFWEDVTVNVEEPDDIIETQTSIKQQAELLLERERSHGRLFNEMKKLVRLQDSPYFGRIDFQEAGEQEVEPIYIGIASLMDKNQEEFLMYDWRAPISSMYYDYTTGPAEYNTMDGRIQGEISLKRQFIIRHGKITSQFDTSLTIGDHLLQAVLGGQSSPQMKNIVATIQKEQNQIIRNQKSKTLIVQGVAGSGKTSAALQRMAYLLYTNRQTLHAENMLLFSPNPLFSSYVSTVLPELGEENILQTTYKEYVEERLGSQFSLESPFEQMETFLSEDIENRDSVQTETIQYKASLEFKKRIDDCLSSLSQEGLIFTDITFRGRILIPSEQIQDYFYTMASSISIPNRLELTARWLMKKLAKHERLERNQNWVREKVELLDKEEYMNAYRERQKKQSVQGNTFGDVDQEWDILSKNVIKKHFQPLKHKIKRLGFVDEKANYRQLFEDQKQPRPSPENWAHICKSTIKKLDQNELTWEEATAYLYFQDQLKGRRAYTQIRHIFIDEAQDYSPFQFAYLKMLFPYCKMTLLGDIHQAIYVQSLNTPSLLSGSSDKDESQERVTLMRSYRSTRPIVEFTRQLIEGGEQIEPVNRSGKKPTLTYATDEKDLHQKLVKRIRASMKTDEHQTIAVICKTMKESKRVHASLPSHISAQLMDQETYTFQQGLLIIPAYLAKGIEFDAVMIYNASQAVYHHALERNLFYTACTRAMHELHLFSLGEETLFMQSVLPDSYSKT